MDKLKGENKICENTIRRQDIKKQTQVANEINREQGSGSEVENCDKHILAALPL